MLEVRTLTNLENIDNSANIRGIAKEYGFHVCILIISIICPAQ